MVMPRTYKPIAMNVVIAISWPWGVLRFIKVCGSTFIERKRLGTLECSKQSGLDAPLSQLVASMLAAGTMVSQGFEVYRCAVACIAIYATVVCGSFAPCGDPNSLFDLERT